MIYTIIIYILFSHFIADFIMQTHEMGINKSTSTKWLTKHIVAYGNTLLALSLPLAIMYTILGKGQYVILIILYILFNMAMHWITDYITSKITKKYWEAQKVHEFFVVIGLDQFIHATTLILSYYWILN